MYLLIPGRHHLLTNFQEDYLRKISDAEQMEDVDAMFLKKHNHNSYYFCRYIG